MNRGPLPLDAVDTVEEAVAKPRVGMDPQHALLLFLWLVCILLCGLGSGTALGTQPVAFFIICGASLLSSLGLIFSIIRPLRDYFEWIAFCSFLFLAVLPVPVFRDQLPDRMIFLDLYFVLLVVTPALLRIWSWKLQSFASAAAVVSTIALWLPVNLWTTLHSVGLVLTTALMSSLVAYRRTVSEQAAFDEATGQSARLISEISRVELPRRMWRVSLLQGGLLAILVFVEAALWGEFVSYELLTKVYGFIVVVFGSMLFGLVRPKDIARTIIFTTVLVGLMLSISESLDRVPSVQGAVPLILLAFTTVYLPWGFACQVAISWLLIICSLVVKSIPYTQLGLSVFASYEAVLSLYSGELAVLVAGTTASVFMSRYVSQTMVSNYVRIDEETPAEDEPQFQAEIPVQRASQAALLVARTERLVNGLFVLTLVSCFFSSVLLVRRDIDLWTVAGLGCLVFGLLWSLMLYVRNKGVVRDQLWFLGAFIALLLFLWPSVLLVQTTEEAPVWVFWPASVLFGIGGIPWGLLELVPLLVVTTVAGVEIINHLDLGVMGTIIFFSSSLLSLFFCLRVGRRLKEANLITYFHSAANRAGEPREVLRALADFLMTMFNSQTALISLERNDLELMRHDKSFPVAVRVRSFETLRADVDELTFDTNGIGLRSVNWIPDVIRLFDKRFGVMTAEHGLLIEIELAHEDALAQPLERPTIFIPFRVPTLAFLRENEFKLVRTLAGITAFRLDTFRERVMRAKSEQGFQVMQAAREFELSTLVHDINNTVQDLTVVCDAILEDVVGEDGDAQELMEKTPGSLGARVKRISNIARSMATVVSDAKRKRELERLTDLTPRELVDVIEVLSDIISFARIRAERKRISIEVLELPEDEIWVKISAHEHLETILRNLLNNAVQYSDPGTVVKIGLRQHGHWIYIDVADNGPGLSDEDCRSIFLSGYRGQSGKKVAGGLGIGLAQSRRVADAAGGSLEVTSEGVGKGATFTVKLPQHKSPERSRAKKAWALMVDDQPSLTDFYSRIAKALHMEAALASSVPEAQEIVKELGKPTFVLTDIHLGTTSGLDLVRFLREEFGNGLPILVVSGLTDEDIGQKAREAGATDFVAKPVGRRALFARIQSLLPM